jgi:DNA-binding GntR family transcriptional regulator
VKDYPIQISKDSATAKYEQIYNHIIGGIQSGKLKHGDKVPSINDISKKNHLAKETVVKAFNKLKEEGILISIHGKGFYINSVNVKTRQHVFVLFDTLTSYKEVMYQEIKETFGKEAVLDIYFHHFNIDMFERIIKENAGNYTAYIIVSYDHQRIPQILRQLPREKLYLLDRNPFNIMHSEGYSGIYQDFEQDIYNALLTAGNKRNQYQKMILVFRNTITIPPNELVTGFEKFCRNHNKEYTVIYEPPSRSLKKGEAYIVIDDGDLVNLILMAREKNYTLGKDFGIISYNDTPLKMIAGNGISVISTDFALMGKAVAQIIMENKLIQIKNPCSFIDRGSY